MLYIVNRFINISAVDNTFHKKTSHPEGQEVCDLIQPLMR